MSAALSGPPTINPLSLGFPYDLEVFTWKIANVSSIVHEVDTVVQSPPFSFDNATWILKMYPYGQSIFHSTGFIDIIIKRLQREGVENGSFMQVFCKDVFGNDIYTRTKTFSCRLPWKREEKMLDFMPNIKDSTEKWKIAPNGTFTLVCALGKETKDLKKQGFPEKSVEPNLDEMRKLSRRRRNPEIGEIFKEYLGLRSFSWKMCKFEEMSPTLPDDYRIQSEAFSFASATWVLNVIPYFLMQHSNKQGYDLVLERLRSEIPEQYVELEISEREEHQQTLFFNVCNTQEVIINLPIIEAIPGRICIHLAVVMKHRKNVGLEFYSQTKLMKPAPANGNISGSKVLQDFKELYLKKEDCDVTIKVKGQEFPAHKVILKARSPVLASAFRSNMKEKVTGIVNIEDCDPSSFSDFLCFIYCGEIENLTDKNVFSLFTAADKYDIPDLRSMCLEFMKQNLSIDTFCDTIALALLHSEKELIQFSTDFFKKNVQEIIVTVKWQSFILKNPLQGNELMIKVFLSSGN